MKASELQNILRNSADPAIAEHSQRFFKTGKGDYGEGDRFLGIRVPVLRKLTSKHKEITLKETTALLKSGYHEERLMALLLLVRKFTSGHAEERTAIYELYLKLTKYINNWDLVDSSAYQIVGVYLEDKDRRPLYDLAKSRNLWERRISIMSTLHFIKQKDFDDTLKLSGLLMDDEEDLIHKAVGWMLRETGNRDRAVEDEFLKKHYQAMPRTMLRYAIEKYPEPERQKYLKGLK